MAYPTYIREKARSMRTERRMTLDEITTRLAIPRTTVWFWIKDLPVPRSEFDARPRTEAQRRAAQANSEKYRLRREAAYEEGVEQFASLAATAGFREFVCLYIAEGSKRCRNTVALCNSDSAVIVMCHRWIARLTDRKIDYSVQYHADQSREELQRFWGDQLGVDPVGIVLLEKSNSGQLRSRTWRCVHGVITVRTCDTLFRARLEAWIDLVKASWQ